MPAIDILNGPTINQGAAESNVLAIGTDYIVGLIAPDDWTPAVVSVIMSPQGDNYYDLFTATGSEFIFNVVPGTILSISPYILMPAAFLKLRSGTRKNPVPQESTRRFYVLGVQKLAAVSAEEAAREITHSPKG